MKKILGAVALLSVALYAKPQVTTTILPTAYFVKQIAGDTVSVNTMVGKNADPHTYEPKPSQMKSLEKSDIFFAVGIEFDDVWLDKIQKQYPNLKIVHTESGIEKIKMIPHHHHDHEEHEGHHHDHHHHHDAHHDHEHKHEHAHKHDHEHHHHDHDHEGHHHHHDGLDPHVWTDPILVKTQAKNILVALESAYPKNKELYEKNYNKFLEKLDELDAYAKDKLSGLKHSKFIVYHPSWGYFAKRYDLKQIPIEVEGKEPKAKDLEELIEEAKEEGTKVIFVAPQFSKKSAKFIASQTGSKVVEIDQLPKNWYKEMKKIIDTFAKSLK